MKTRDSDHPLAIWLEKQGETGHKWARENGFGIATIYHLMRGRAPHMTTLGKIEMATQGDVTVAAMFNWYFINHNKEETNLP